MYDIYRITNSINGKIYIGLTGWGYEERWLRHKSASRLGVETYLYNAVRKHGEENFSIELIEQTETIEQAKEREKFWIHQFNSIDRDLGYNIKDGGEGNELPEETKQKISKTNRQRFIDNPELRQRISIQKKGIKYPPEYGRKISVAKKGKTPNRDYTMSDEQKDKLRLANLAQFSSEDSRKKHSEIMKAYYAKKKLDSNLTLGESLEPIMG